jgi:hypothetical protein
MAIQLNPEQEQVVGEAIHAGLIRVPDDVIDIGIQAIRQQLEARENSSETMSADEWTRELHAWIHSHPTTTRVLSDEAISRESIYETRGQ